MRREEAQELEDYEIAPKGFRTWEPWAIWSWKHDNPGWMKDLVDSKEKREKELIHQAKVLANALEDWGLVPEGFATTCTMEILNAWQDEHPNWFDDFRKAGTERAKQKGLEKMALPTEALTNSSVKSGDSH